MSRELRVYVDSALVGTLFEHQGIWSFQYEPDWLASGFDLSPGLKRQKAAIQDAASVRPVQWFFDNLLPEEIARAQLAATLPNKSADAWDMLAHFGAESAGALTLLPPHTTLPEAGLQELTDAALDERIRTMPKVPLAAKAPKKMSLAGAQQKLPIVIDQTGRLFEPTGAYASTHILKPDSTSEHYPDSAVNEWFTARLAQRMGLRVPPVQLRYVPAPVYIIERFDRVHAEGSIQRLHALDAPQLMTLSAEVKYAKSGVEALLEISELCREKAATRIALFEWALFNVFIGNSDAHLKNLSVLASNQGYSLAPHYDLVATAVWHVPELSGNSEPTWPNIPMSFAMGGAARYSELTRENIALFAADLKVPSRVVERTLRNYIVNILREAESLLDEFEARTDVPGEQRAAHSRMLRSIVHVPIKSMVNQLSLGLRERA